jgi:HD-like signal output (HDOD) protein/CheY-like chemotaxis protein
VRKSILFVGEHESLGLEFQTMGYGVEDSQAVQFARSGEEALALCGDHSFDAVVADASLDGMKGPEFLNAFMQRQPNAMRIVTSDLADVEGTMKCIGHAHHHLLKPCSAATLHDALRQGLAAEAWLPSEPAQELISQMRQVPSPPKTYFQIAEEAKSPTCSLEKIAALIAEDPAVTAKVMQLANSAVFGLQLRIVHPLEAINYIGLETTKALVLLAHTFSSFDQITLAGFSIEELWTHSVRTGQLAQRIAIFENAPMEIVEEAFAAGLLHDIGKLLLAANTPDLFTKALKLSRRLHCNLWEAEAQVLPNVGHAGLGATILGIWGLPKPIIEAVALHHCPWRNFQHSFSPIAAVHVANIFEHETRPDPHIILPSQINSAYLRELGLEERPNEWRKSLLHAAQQELNGR